MKKKYLKKILVVMLTAMTVSATPGIANAMSGDSKQTIENLNKNIQNHSLDKNVAIQSLDQLEKIADEDDDAKEKVSFTLGAMINAGLFGQTYGNLDGYMCSSKHISKIIKIFDICSSCDCAKLNAAFGIDAMACESLLGRTMAYESKIATAQFCSSDQFCDVIGILDKCLKYSDNSVKEKDNLEIKRSIVSSIFFMADKGVLGGTLPNEEHISLSILAKPQMPKRPAEQISQIVQFLKKCSQNNETNVAYSICVLLQRHLLDEYSTDEIFDILHTCSNKSWAIRSVANAIEQMVNNGLLNKQSINETSIHTLQKCAEDHDTKFIISKVIKNMVERGLLNECTQNQVQQIVDSLLSCSDYSDFAKENVTKSIKSMAEKDLLNECTQNQIQQIVDSLIQNLRNNNTMDTATTIIAAIAKKGLLNECTSAQIQQMLNLFNEHLVADLAQRNNENTTKIFEILNACSKIDFAKENISDIASMLATDKIFYAYLGEQIPNHRLRDLVDILNSCSETQDQKTKSKVAFALAYMIREILIGNLSSKYIPYQISQKIPQIIEMLKRCSEVDGDKFYVAASIRFLDMKKFFQLLTYGQNSNLIDTINNCLKFDGTRTKTGQELNDDQKDTLAQTSEAIRQLRKSSFKAGLAPDLNVRFDQISDKCQNLVNNTNFF